ncbi:MAG: hypothetical protein R6U36_06615 [Candidatus Fermentibacteraceae bacterium]
MAPTVRLRAVLTLALIALLSCASEGPRKRIVGRWNVTFEGRANTVEISEDGTMRARGGQIQYWTLEEGDSLILRVGPSPSETAAEFVLRLQGDSAFTLHRQGRTTTFRRLR